jgi:GT2 family glycosyltransferase
MADKLISIVIPHWNAKDLLHDCLSSLSKITYPNWQVVVVDNASTDGSVEDMEKYFPETVIVKNKVNNGFAPACNQGIKKALELGADFVLLLNNDTVVAPDFLEKMMLAAKEEKTGIIGAKIYYADEPGIIWFAGGNFIKWRTSGQHAYWQQPDNENLKGIRETDFITGCVMLIKKEVFDDIGFLYEPYFLTVEDLDFCYRARERGWKTKVALDAKVYHKVSFSRQGEFSFSNGYYGTRNRLHFAFYRTGNYAGGLIFLFLVLPIRLGQWLIEGKKKMLKGSLYGLKDFFLGRMGPRKN